MNFIPLSPDLGLLILRLGLGVVFLAHGPAKLMNPTGMSAALGLPKNLVTGVGLLEAVGAVSMITGLWTQLGAVCLAAVMCGAIYMKTQKWNKKFTGESGWELDFIILTAAIAIFFIGPGYLAI